MKNQVPEIVERFYDFVLVLVQKTSRFPKSHRYLLGEKIEVLAFSISVVGSWFDELTMCCLGQSGHGEVLEP